MTNVILVNTNHNKRGGRKVRARSVNETQSNEPRSAEEPGAKIKRLIKENGWSQELLAQRAKIKASMLSRLLSGGRQWKFEYLSQIAVAFAISVEDLTKGTTAEGAEGLERAPEVAKDALTLAQEALGEQQQENDELLAKQESSQKEIEDLRAERDAIRVERDLRPTPEAWAAKISECSDLSSQNAELQKRLRSTEDSLSAERKKYSAVVEENNAVKQELSKEREKNQKLLREKLYLQSEKNIIQKKADEAYKLAAQYQQAEAQLKKAKSNSDTLAVLAGLGLIGAALSKK